MSHTPAFALWIKQQDSGDSKSRRGRHLSNISGFLALHGLAGVLVFKVHLGLIEPSVVWSDPHPETQGWAAALFCFHLLCEVERRGWFMSFSCHVSPRAGRRARGWMGSAHLPIYYTCQLGRDFFIFLFFYLVKGPSAMNQWSEDDSWFVNLDSIKWLCFGGLWR